MPTDRPNQTVMMRASTENRARAQRVLLLAIIAVVLLQFCLIDPNMASNEKVGLRRIDVDEWEKSIVMSEDPNTTTTLTSDANGPARSEGIAASLNRTQTLEYCGNCPYDNSKTCSDRAAYIRQRYHLSEQKARESIMDRCGVDYSTEPYVMLHVGPHKTGTTAIQSFIYQALYKNETFLGDDNWSIPTWDDMPGEI